MLQSCTHFPLNKTLTTMEKILRRQCNIPPLPLGITPKSVPKTIHVAPSPSPPHPKGTPRPSLKGTTSPPRPKADA